MLTTLSSHSSTLTAPQQQAIYLPGPLIVSASAGAGKTRILVERYVHLVLSRCTIRRIVAITFTRKAAAEMLERTARWLEQLYTIATQPDELSFLRTVREELMSAQISTFHSYCSYLLRRFPIEAGVPPSFGELSPAERREILRRCLRTIVEQWLVSSKRSSLAHLIDTFGSYSTLETTVERLLSSPEQLDLIRLESHTSTPERISSQAFNLVSTLRQIWYQLVLVAQCEKPLTKAVANEGDTINECLAQLQRLGSTRSMTGEFEELSQYLEKLLGIFHTANGELRAYWRTYSTPQQARLAASCARIIRELLDIDLNHEHLAWQMADELLSLTREILEIFDQEKIARGVFEPDDLQRLALRLLECGSVRNRLQGEIQHILVDEFQDTNPLQYALVRALAPLFNRNKPELFIVGDPKQSIYGFRGADVRVFERARQDITSIAGNDHHIHLQTTFRMTPPLVALVNRIMRQTMPEQTEGYFVGYEELCTARPALSCPSSLLAILISVSDEKDLFNEALLVAQHIQHLVADEQAKVWDDNATAFRPVQYRDIALLVRKSSIFEAYTRALRQANIPFRIESGRGFYQTQEVLDIAAFLRLLHNVHDDIALAAVLRSPFIGLSDSDLVCIAQAEPSSGSLYERLRGYTEQGSTGEEIKKAVELLDELLPVAVLMPPAALIRLLLSRTPWRQRLANSPRAAQIDANIEKLLSYARTFQQRGFRNLLDFVEELEQLRFVAETEAEAAVISDDNIVSLMTIHAAKGLEFPVVYLIGTGERSQGPSSPYVVTEELGITLRKVANKQTATSSLANYLVQRREEAEEQRLLYVALTRAKDHLLIAGSLYRSSDNRRISINGALATISSALDIDWNEQIGLRSISITEEVRTTPDKPGQNMTVPIEIIYEMPPSEPPQAPTLPTTPPRLMIEPVVSYTSGEIISASQLLLYNKSPYEFFRIYRCGLPSKDDSFQRALAELEDEDNVVGTYPGQLIHDALATLLSLQRWDSEALHGAIDRAFNYRHGIKEASLYRRVESDVRATIEYLQQTDMLPQRALVEQPIMIPCGEDFLLGIPDALVSTSSGWEIWDWKTNRRDKRSSAEWLEYYRLQLEVYILLASFSIKEQSHFTARLIFTRPPIEVQSITIPCSQVQRIMDNVTSTIAAVKHTTMLCS